MTRYFVFRIRKELEDFSAYVSFKWKRSKHHKLSVVVRTAKYVQKVPDIINVDDVSSWRSSQTYETQSYVMKTDNTQKQCKLTEVLNKLKQPEATRRAWHVLILLGGKKFDQDQKAKHCSWLLNRVWIKLFCCIRLSYDDFIWSSVLKTLILQLCLIYLDLNKLLHITQL